MKTTQRVPRMALVWIALVVPSVLSLCHAETLKKNCERIVADHYPRQYVSYYTSTPPSIDGKLNEPVWEDVEWSALFVDINTSLVPPHRTAFKIRHDDEWVYVGGFVEEPRIWANITYCCHCINASANQVIFTDNDFEVFFDVDGTTRYYKEYEMNAANANWDLCLNRPYENGGYENSTRVRCSCPSLLRPFTF
jgi:hypothetical protein